MRNVYLIRHGCPDAPEHTCGYREDVPLNRFGLLQAERLGRWAAEKNLTAVFASPLRRSLQTARAVAGERVPVILNSELREMETGAWTGLTFREIRARYPREYAARGEHVGTVPPPGGESFQTAGARLGRCVERLLQESGGDIAVVAHGGVNRGWLCVLLGREPDEAPGLPQSWGCINELETDGAGSWRVLSLGRQPDRAPNEAAAERLLVRCCTPARVIAHGEAVAVLALEIAERSGAEVDRGLLESACRLHDLLREKADHAGAGADLLMREGYPECAAVVAAHHDLPEDASPEAKLLYLADKLVLGTEPVCLEERFRLSRKKCTTPEARAAWQRRYADARRCAEEFQVCLTCGEGAVIPPPHCLVFAGRERLISSLTPEAGEG